MSADRADRPDRAAVAVVAGVVDALHVDGVIQAAPGVPVVVAFEDVFAAVVELAVAQQEPQPAIFQVVLVVALDGVRDHGDAELVLGAMQAAHGVVAAKLHGLVHLGVGEGLVLALVPAEAAEGAQVAGDVLLGVVAEAVLEGAEVLVGGDGGGGVDAGEVGLDGLAVVAHVGAVGEEEDALRAFLAGHDALAQLELAVVGAGAAEGPVQIDAVGDDGHGEESVAQAPDAVVVLGHAAQGVAAGVGGVVPGAVVVHGPVHELEVGVGAHIVDVEEIGQGHLAQAELDAPGGNLGGEREEIRILGADLIGKADDLVNLVTGGIRIDAEIGVADHVDVGLAGQPQRLAQAASQGGFEIEDKVGVVADGMSGAPGGV